jgi:hypothetical protein
MSVVAHPGDKIEIEPYLFTYPKNKVEYGFIQSQEPGTIRLFSDDGETGKLELKDGKLTFTGDIDASAKAFVDAVNRML